MDAQTIKQIIADKITGKIEPRHTEKGHFYYFLDSGHIVSSVTGKIGAVVAKPHLMRWGIKMAIEWLSVDLRWKKLALPEWRQAMINGAQAAPFDVRDEAGSVGHDAHDAIERWLNQSIADNEMHEDITVFAKPNCDFRAIAAMRGVQKLFKDKKIIPIASEMLVGDYRYSAGTLDLLCYWGKDLCLVDWKSSNQVSQEYILQTTAYAKFFESMTGVKIKKIKIIHLSKDSDKYTIYAVKNINKAWKAFKQVCGVYDWKMDKGSVLEKDIKRMKI